MIFGHLITLHTWRHMYQKLPGYVSKFDWILRSTYYMWLFVSWTFKVTHIQKPANSFQNRSFLLRCLANDRGRDTHFSSLIYIVKNGLYLTDYCELSVRVSSVYRYRYMMRILAFSKTFYQQQFKCSFNRRSTKSELVTAVRVFQSTCVYMYIITIWRQHGCFCHACMHF